MDKLISPKLRCLPPHGSSKYCHPSSWGRQRLDLRDIRTLSSPTMRSSEHYLSLNIEELLMNQIKPCACFVETMLSQHLTCFPIRFLICYLIFSFSCKLLFVYGFEYLLYSHISNFCLFKKSTVFV